MFPGTQTKISRHSGSAAAVAIFFFEFFFAGEGGRGLMKESARERGDRGREVLLTTTE